MTRVADDDALARAFARSKRRRFWIVLAITALLAWGCAAWLTVPAWRKVAARGWPEAAAKVERIEKVGTESAEKQLLGSRVRLTFRYVTPDGMRREARQEVSGTFARRHRINEYGYFVPAGLSGRERLGELACWYDPATPARAVVERSLSRADVMALSPLLILVLGALIAGAERRGVKHASDPSARLLARNDRHWSLGSGDTLRAAAKREPAYDAGSILAGVIVDWPDLDVSVTPHPIVRGRPATVRVTLLPDRRGRRRRVRATLMIGPFNLSGRPSRARWSAVIFDGVLAPHEPVSATVNVPRAADLPVGCDDCLLRVTPRAWLGTSQSRVLWLGLDAS